MAEPTLALDFAALRKEIADELGYGRDSANWDATQGERITSILSQGLRQFYAADQLEGKPAHRWKFLYPTTTLATVEDDYDYDLPDNFGGLAGPITFEADNGLWMPNMISDGEWRWLRSRSTATGRPAYVAHRITAAAHGATSTRHELLLYPTPDAVYTLSYRYRALQNVLASGEYPLGSADHSETILASCLAVCERRMNGGSQGPNWAHYLARLAASIGIDTDHEPRNLGRNADGPIEVDRQRQTFGTATVTYNGDPI